MQQEIQTRIQSINHQVNYFNNFKLIKICELKITKNQEECKQTNRPIKFLQSLEIVLKRIIAQISNTKFSLINNDQKNFEQFIEQKFQDDYTKIEDLLQRQQQKNRNHLKKQFQTKQIFNDILSDINDQKYENQKLNTRINKLNQQLQQKTIEIMHLKNQNKALQRDARKTNINQSNERKRQKNNNHQLNSQSFELVRGTQTSRQRTGSRMNNKQTKQDLIHQKYTSQKKKIYQTLNPTQNQNIKKNSLTLKYLNNKNQQKNIVSAFSSQRKSYSRKKSQPYKKSPLKKDRKWLQHNIKKKKKQFKGFIQVFL